LGNGAGATERDLPTLVAGGATNWQAVSAGSFHTCAVRTTGVAWCWGADFQGALGNGAPGTSRFSPGKVGGPVTDWRVINAGGLHTCARRATGHLYCWGLDGEGQVGDGGPNLAELPLPTMVGGGATDWLTVDGGGLHTCARTSTRRAYCWGDDDEGQVGDGPTIADHSRPGEVFVP
jgi:alpha-tubulin suppressor-like RCC1 family protein